MKIEKVKNGKINYKEYHNKTWDFLVPTVRAWGEEFVQAWNLIYKVSVGIYDYSLEGVSKYNGENLFCLVDNNYNVKSFENFINLCQDKPYYLSHYPYQNLESGLTMFVIRIHPTLINSYENFLKGQYSKMYSKEQINILFPEKTKKETRDILLKDYEAFCKYQEIFYDTFGNNLTDRDVEYSLPLINKEEIFNFNRDKPKFYTEEIRVW